MDDDKNLLLMEFGYPHLPQPKKDKPSFDEKEFFVMTEKGKKAWSDVEDADEWLENLRSGK